jgi:hypothetical protein
MSNIQVNNRTIGTLALKEREVRGEGGPHDPRIVFPLAVTIHPQPAGAMLALTELRCSLHLTTPRPWRWEVQPLSKVLFA